MQVWRDSHAPASLLSRLGQLMLRCKRPGQPSWLARRRGNQETHTPAAPSHAPSAVPEIRPAAKRSLLARFFDAMAEARMRQAVRELAMHRHLVPEALLKKYGYTATLADDSAYPFTP